MIAIGFCLAKFKIVNVDIFKKINTFLFKGCFVCLVANNLVTRDISSFSFVPFVIGALSLVTTILTFTLIFAFKFDDRFEVFLSTALPAVYVNYVIIGLPIFNSIWSEAESSIVFIITLSNDLVTVPLYLALTAFYHVYRNNRDHREKGEPEEKFSLRTCGGILMSLATNPIFIGYIIGFGWSGLKLPMFTFLDTILKYLSDTVLAGSCMCVGSFLAEHSLISCHWLQFVVCLVGRHILMPSFSLLYCKLLKIDGRTARQCVIMTALPSAVASYLLSTNGGVGAGVASTMIFWTSILFLPAVIGWLELIEKLNIFPENTDAPAV
ncbi:Auxin Efflux Carrier family protein [Tritrichomonas foetus]|uniref:Auxin Efflux Carrier family protein n=1 Tax=Tritrichomonas foetus TaxID=1144522 RepID=A0A1J4J8A5_9EUKA|nr:Auxin Efflux Carrier family protein [Tritrichomonas foetus]|eukprot:OHS95426.1 Auxin Efflux Carrier family protein [Tritrichomonas foetus]